VTSTAVTSSDRILASDQALRWLASLLAVVGIAEALALVALGSQGDPRFAIGLDLPTIGFLMSIVLFPLVGALIVRRRPRTLVAWLMVADGVLLGVGLVLYAWSLFQVPQPGIGQLAVKPPAIALWGLLVSNLFFLPTIGVGSTALLLLFPTDRLLSPRWRVAFVLSVVGATGWLIGTSLHAGTLTNDIDARNPIGLAPDASPVLETIANIGNACVAIGFALAALSLVVRYRQADSMVAAQLRWIALVAVPAAALLGFAAFQLGPITDLAFGLGLTVLACLPIAIGIAVTRYRLYDIDFLINRAIVYGSLTAILAGVFTAAVSLAQRVFIAVTGQTSDAALVLTTLIVATLYAPLRKRLEAIIDRSFKYAERRFGPYVDEVRRVLSVIDVGQAADRLAAEAVREAGAGGAAVVGESGRVLGVAGLWDASRRPEALVVDVGVPPFAAVLLLARSGRDPSAIDPAAIEPLRQAARLAATAVRPPEPEPEPELEPEQVVGEPQP
jgi:hypothetical protein